jgi:hypothetical protein
MDLDMIGEIIVFGFAIIAAAVLLGFTYVVLGVILLRAACGSRRNHPICRACNSRLSDSMTETACPGCQSSLAQVGTRPVIEGPRWSMMLASMILIILAFRFPWWAISAMS